MANPKAAMDAGLEDGAAAELGAAAAVVADANQEVVAPVAVANQEVVAPVADLEDAALVEKKRLYAESDKLYEESEYYEPCEYEFVDDVEEENLESYTMRQLRKFESEELKTMKRGKFFCTFCPSKVKKGDRSSLELHAMDIRENSKDLQARDDHMALAKYLMGDRLPAHGRPSKKLRIN